MRALAAMSLSVVAAGGPLAAGAQGRPAADPLARFTGQTPAWHACARDGDDTDGRDLDAAGLTCAEVTVPLDHRHPDGRTTSVAIARSPAPDAARRIGALAVNLGGPALPVVARTALAREALGDAGARFDVIGVDPRFTGRNAPFDCGLTASWNPRSAGADLGSFLASVRLAADVAWRCSRAHGDLLPHLTTANAARDLDIVRAALGEEKLSYLGYSYGTYLGALYTQLFPGRADRIVLDSAIDPTRPGTRLLRDNAPEREAALRTWAARAAAHDDLLHLGTTPEAVLAVVDGVYRAAARRPLVLGAHRVDDTTVPALFTEWLVDEREDHDLGLAETVQVLADAAAGRAVTVPGALDERLTALLTGADSPRRSVQAAIMCADAAVPRDPAWYWRDIAAHRAGSPLFEPQSRTIPPCAFWPRAGVDPAPAVDNAVPALLVHAAGDVDATDAMGRAMHRALRGSRRVTLAGVRTHMVYGLWPSACAEAAVAGYLDSGALPAADLTCEREA
jgi:pimeloyl-ACP methyl ester carboxylesterase